MTIITVFGDVACPFTYVGLSMLFAERDRRAADVRFRVRAWPLELINDAPLDPAHVSREVEALRVVVPGSFAGFDPATFPRTSVPAFGLVDAAYERSDHDGESAAIAVRVALFERGLDIGDSDVLTGLAAAIGVTLPTDEAARAIAERDHAAGQDLGVVGSPYFITRDRGWFCPMLAISQHEGRFTVTIDDTTKRDFINNVFDR